MQSRLGSLLEQCLNIASGFLLSLLIWQLLGPALGYHVSMHDNLLITSIFTVVSIVRGYLWRRFFNARLKKAFAP